LLALATTTLPENVITASELDTEMFSCTLACVPAGAQLPKLNVVFEATAPY